MTYVEKLLQMQTRLAAGFDHEDAPALPRYLLVKQERSQRQAAEDDGGTSDLPKQNGQSDAAQLLRKLQRLQTAAEISPERMRMKEEVQQTILHHSQSVLPSQTRQSAYEGGLIGDFRQTMVTAGLAGIRTQRSMSEISRYFERDARRYGG